MFRRSFPKFFKRSYPVFGIPNIKEWMNKEYTSPYEVECPLQCVILYNPSAHANNVAVHDLLHAWPGLNIVQTIQEGRTPVVGATHQIFIPKGSWGDMKVFQQSLEEYKLKNRHMNKIKCGFYPIWSSMAEDSSIARAVQGLGLHWVGAEPKAMDGLGKIEYKSFCAKHNLPTADFFVLSGAETDIDSACAAMADRYWEKVKGTSLEGKACFIKSEYGGGGRGTKKAQPDKESIMTALRGVCTETKSTKGIYVEAALDLEGASLYQIEMEVDAGAVVDGGRLVYFNARNQKMIELGFSGKEIVKFLPQEIYDQCVHATEVIGKESKYDGRGTNEILIAKMADGEWKCFCSEFNKRVQVEHKALSNLKRDKLGNLFNTIADQVMRSCGYRPPDYTTDLHSSGAEAVAHIRLIAPKILPNGELQFPVGVEVDDVILPRGFNAVCNTGKLYADTDAQFGCSVILGANWPKLLGSLRKFSTETVILGKNIGRDYFGFLRKFFDDERVANLSLGCNKTLTVLDNESKPDGRIAQVVHYLNGGVARTLVNGYRPEGGVKNRGYPTQEQIDSYIKLRDDLLRVPISTKSPFVNYLEHLDETKYFAEMRDVLQKTGGGMISVFPRDVQQECSGSESHLISYPARLLTERFGPECGYIGYETGGAQYQTAEMNMINSAKVLREGMLSNMPTFSLTRSHWMNALEKLNPAQIKYILSCTAKIVTDRFSLGSDPKVIPYFPYQFHAGNVVQQDEVTGLMLDYKMSPVPNFVWDPRFTLGDYESWLLRQFAVWRSKGRKLHHIRIKNAGQQKEWTSDMIQSYVSCTRKLYKKEYGQDTEPIIQLHNHNFNGLAPHVAYRALKKCQEDGFQHLIVDTAPPLMTHNSNLVVARALKMTNEQMDALHYYNESAHTIWQLTERFRDFLQVRISPDTIWAGGTGSSDLAAAEKIGIRRQEIEDAKLLGAQVSGLGGIVTPYSQWSMVIGYMCFKQGLKTLDAVTKHVNGGGLLNLPANILQGLDQWHTLLQKPDLVKKLIENHKASDPSVFKAKEAVNSFDEAALRQKVRNISKDWPITDDTIMRVLSYGDIALKNIKAEVEGTDNSWLLRYPNIAYAKKVPAGEVFSVKGVPVTFEGIEAKEGSAEVTVTFKFEGHWVRVRTMDNERQRQITKIVENAVPSADPANPDHVGAFMPGILEAVNVSVGHIVNIGDVLYSINSMKMVTTFKATAAHAGKNVDRIYVHAGEELAVDTNGNPPLVMSLSKPTQ